MVGRALSIAVFLTLTACNQPPPPTTADIARTALKSLADDATDEEVELRQLAETAGAGHRVICGRSNFTAGYPARDSYGEFVVLDGQLLNSAPAPDIEALATACLAKIPQGPPMPPGPHD